MNLPHVALLLFFEINGVKTATYYKVENRALCEQTLPEALEQLERQGAVEISGDCLTQEQAIARLNEHHCELWNPREHNGEFFCGPYK